MPFDLLERGRFTGKPLHLFVFMRQGIVWRFCSGDQDEEHGGEDFIATSIARSALKDSTESPKNNVTITLPYLLDPAASEYPPTQAFGDNWRPYPPSDRIFVICMAKHRGETDAAVEWMGRVVASKFSDTSLELTCEPTRSSGRRSGTQKRFQVACWKTVGSLGLGLCNLNMGPGRIAATLTAVAGDDVTAAAFADPPRPIVRLEWTDEADVAHAVDVEAQVGTTLTLADATGLVIGSEVTAVTLPNWGFPATLTAVDGLTLTAAEFASDIPEGFSLHGGWFEWTRVDGLIERRSIKAHSANTIQVLYGAIDLAPDLQGVAYVGCAHTWAACEAFGNEKNYGGAPYKPVKNPMSGMPVW